MSLPSHPYIAGRRDVVRELEMEFVSGGGSRPLGILNTPGIGLEASSGPLTALDLERAVQAVSQQFLRPYGPLTTYGPGWPD